MIYEETKNFNINRILLLIIGLWPYQRSKLVHFQVILYIVLLTNSIIFQITLFICIKCSIDIIINILCTMLYSVTYVIVYNSFWINIHTIRCLLEQLQCICNELKDENEITIIKKYGNKTKRQTVILLSITLCGILFFISLAIIWPGIVDLDIILFLNGSQPCCTKRAIITEYFFDQKHRFYLILLHIHVPFFVGGFTVTVIGSILIGYIKYICGMFKIASYRIEQAMMINMLEDINLKQAIGIDKRIICGIEIHCKAMKFSKFLTSTFEKMFLALIFIATINLSLHLFEIFRCVLIEDNAGKLFIHSMMTCMILMYMFLANFAGQQIIDHNNDVFFAAYNIQWYVAPLRTQKLILFLLQKGNTAFNLSIAGIFTASFECFATLTKQAISYFAVMYSTQIQ